MVGEGGGYSVCVCLYSVCVSALCVCLCVKFVSHAAVCRRLVEKLDNMKKNAIGNGTTQCILCGDEFGLLGASPTYCDDCKKVTNPPCHPFAGT